jgi:hypothetical protein
LKRENLIENSLGLIGLVIWWEQFLIVLAGIVSAMLLLGGALAIYLGFDELRDSWKSDEAAEPSSEGSEGEQSPVNDSALQIVKDHRQGQQMALPFLFDPPSPNLIFKYRFELHKYNLIANG